MIRSVLRPVGETSTLTNRKKHRAMRSIKRGPRKVDRLFGERRSDEAKSLAQGAKAHVAKSATTTQCDNVSDRNTTNLVG